MASKYSKEELWQLRNNIPISVLIADVFAIPSKIADGYFRFLCPLCSEFQTAVNPKKNLARCFRCRINFNTIDMAKQVKHYDFQESVEFLQDILQKLQKKK